MRKAVSAPDSNINKKYEELQAQVDKQVDILAKQQRCLEVLDRKEIENNLTITGVMDKDESVERRISKKDKLSSTSSKVGHGVGL